MANYLIIRNKNVFNRISSVKRRNKYKLLLGSFVLFRIFTPTNKKTKDMILLTFTILSILAFVAFKCEKHIKDYLSQL